MKFVYLYLTFLTLTIGMISCRKDPSTPLSIEVGNYSALRIAHHDTILIGGYYDKQVLGIDLDLDGIDDIGIISNVWGSPGMGHHPEADIACLNQDTYLNIIHTLDTTFLKIRIDTHYSSPNQLLYIDYIEYYSCDRRYGEDSIVRIQEKEHINVLKKYDKISINDSWICDSVDLNHQGGSPWPERLYYSGDTTINKYVNSYYECRSFPNDKIAYIGIKKLKLGQEKLGWIKLSISNYYKVSILESALQE